MTKPHHPMHISRPLQRGGFHSRHFGPVEVVVEQVVFHGDVDKLAQLRRMVAKGARDPGIVRMGSALVRRCKPDDYRCMVQEIQAFVRDGIRYQHDPDRREQLADAAVTLQKGYDDCDGKAVLCAALVRAVGIEADLLPIWAGPVLSHVMAEARWPGSERLPGSLRDGWQMLETTIRGVGVGDSPMTGQRNSETGKLALT